MVGRLENDKVIGGQHICFQKYMLGTCCAVNLMLVSMGCRFTFYSLFMDIQNSFMDIQNSFLDIQKSIFGYP